MPIGFRYAANRVVLADIPPSVHPDAVCGNTRVVGDVCIADSALVEDCQLIGPLVIGARARLRDSRVGPDVAIGDDCVLESVTIANAIVMEQATLLDCAGIEDSMIGRFATVCGAPAGSKLTLGDHSRFEAAP